ncbi:hypothetical protein MBLNU230_g4421t1 [Neophaeotheca triangularis]
MSAMQWGARLAPVFLVLIVAYVTYAVVVALVVDFLLYPDNASPEHSRVTEGSVILTIFMVLWTLMVTSFLRCIWHGCFDAGFLAPFGPHDDQEKQGKSQGEWRRLKGDWYPRYVRPAPSLESIQSQDFYVSTEDGKPKWCETCQIWKPDRAHHLKDIGYCVSRLDHYCPWVGGIVSQRNFKFFIQFDVYAALFSLYAMIITGFYLDHQVTEYARTVNMGVTMGLGVFFVLLAGGTGTSGILCAGNNLTTLENVHQKDAVWTLAIRCSPKTDTDLSTTTSPSDSSDDQPQTLPAGYKLIKTPEGTNPFDMGVVANLEQVMGRYPWDWLLPIRGSPLSDPESPVPPPSIAVEYLRQCLERGEEGVDPKVKHDYERARVRGRRFPHVLAAAGAPMRTCKYAVKSKKAKKGGGEGGTQ